VKSREIGERFDADGAITIGSSPQQFAAFLKSEMTKWKGDQGGEHSVRTMMNAE
jgi:hypothetical protein